MEGAKKQGCCKAQLQRLWAVDAAQDLLLSSPYHHAVFLADKSAEENVKLNCYVHKKCSLQRGIWSTMGGEKEEREKTNSFKGKTQADGACIFCQISALMPVELSSEIHILPPRPQWACLCTTALPPNNDTLPCLARWKEGSDPTNPQACRQPAWSRSAALQEPFPLLWDDSTRFLKASPHLLEAKGGEDLSDCICDPGNSSQAETAESLIFRKIT